MRSTLYIVVHSLNKWWIDKEGKSYGPFATQAEAISAGPKFIDLMGNPALKNELYAADENGKFCLVWSSVPIAQLP